MHKFAFSGRTPSGAAERSWAFPQIPNRKADRGCKRSVGEGDVGVSSRNMGRKGGKKPGSLGKEWKKGGSPLHFRKWFDATEWGKCLNSAEHV